MINRLKPKNAKEFLKKYVAVILAIVVYGINLKTLVLNANLIGSGIMGLSIFTQKIFIDFFNKDVPLTLITVIYNIIPATISLIIVGKKFTIMSFVILFSMTTISDLIPSMPITNDNLVAAVFAGILNGFSLGLILRMGLGSGGTDFISVAVAKKYHKPIFNYILIFNICLIAVQGKLYSFEQALYSIVYQFVSTQMINYLYRHFEKRTLLIITDKAKEISRAVIEKSTHSVTQIEAFGSFSETKKNLLYLIVTEPELKIILQTVRDIDENAFINVIKSTEVRGNFNYLPVT